MAAQKEQTFIACKPDAVQRGLFLQEIISPTIYHPLGIVGEIIARFEKRGFKLIAMKMILVCVEENIRKSLYFSAFG